MGDLRLRLPKPVAPYFGTIDATTFGNQCIQLPGSATNLSVPQDEDCLNLNVIVPANVTAGSKLPVAVVGELIRLVTCKGLTGPPRSGYMEVRIACDGIVIPN